MGKCKANPNSAVKACLKHMFKDSDSLVARQNSSSKFERRQIFNSKMDIYTDSNTESRTKLNSNNSDQGESNTFYTCKLEINDFVLLKFAGMRSKKYFVGQIVGKETMIIK